VKFLLDVPVGREIAEWLQEQGYDVSEVRTIDPALSDLAILRLARAQSRIVITTDKDFGELAVRQGEAHCGIVRLPDVRATERKAMLSTLIYQSRRQSSQIAAHAESPHSLPLKGVGFFSRG
jgi:predicted nuclease of predicted toxin-antitoxin system